MTPDFKLPDSADKALANLSDHPTKQIGQTLGDMWYLAFGGISALADKRRLKYAHSLEMMKKELEAKVSAIPEEKRVEPDTQVILTALDDAKYCADNKELRELFINLIAASINIDMVEKVHPSFSNIIRQMTSRDAKNLIVFTNKRMYPLATFICKHENGGRRTFLQNVFLGNPEMDDFRAQAVSIGCLSMLGLLELNNRVYKNEDFEVFKTTKAYQDIVAITQKPNSGYTEVILEHGSVELTYFGSRFIEVCT